LTNAPSREAEGSLLWTTMPLRRLLDNDGYRTRFLNRCADLLNRTLSTSNVLRHIAAFEARIGPEMAAETDRWGWAKAENHPGQWHENVESIQAFAEQRPDMLRGFVTNHFQLPGIAAVEVRISGGQGSVQISTLPAVSEAWSGVYFQGVPIPVMAVPAPGFRFVSWAQDASGSAPEIQFTPNSGTAVIEAVFGP
jgi:hypothetical protein